MASNPSSTPPREIFSTSTTKPQSLLASLILNIACHGMAILEVYLLSVLHGRKNGAFLGLVLEALTKLINIVGALNPGNFGTYEGGNMILTRLLGIAGAAGLTLALCRRARTLFWEAIGVLCLIAMSKATSRSKLARSEATGRANACDLLLSQIPCDSIQQ